MKRFVKIMCLVLAFTMCLAIPVGAEAISPYASNYFGSYNAYLSGETSTSFEVWFSVTALRRMDKLGVDYIHILRSSDGNNWTVVKTYDSDDYPSLMATNTSSHSGHVTYTNKQSGYQYRAYVKFYAKEGNNSGVLGAYAYF